MFVINLAVSRTQSTHSSSAVAGPNNNSKNMKNTACLMTTNIEVQNERVKQDEL